MNSIRQFTEMLIRRKDELLKVRKTILGRNSNGLFQVVIPEDSSLAPAEIAHLKVDFVGCITPDLYLSSLFFEVFCFDSLRINPGGLILTDLHVHWRPKLAPSPRETNVRYLVLFNMSLIIFDRFT